MTSSTHSPLSSSDLCCKSAQREAADLIAHAMTCVAPSWCSSPHQLPALLRTNQRKPPAPLVPSMSPRASSHFSQLRTTRAAAACIAPTCLYSMLDLAVHPAVHSLAKPLMSSSIAVKTHRTSPRSPSKSYYQTSRHGHVYLTPIFSRASRGRIGRSSCGRDARVVHAVCLFGRCSSFRKRVSRNRKRRSCLAARCCGPVIGYVLSLF